MFACLFLTIFVTSCTNTVVYKTTPDATLQDREVVVDNSQTKHRPQYSDEKIREAIIQQSIYRSSENCPCPYSRASDGSQCGRTSAYSSPGGQDQICYAEQISDQWVYRYRRALQERTM